MTQNSEQLTTLQVRGADSPLRRATGGDRRGTRSGSRGRSGSFIGSPSFCRLVSVRRASPGLQRSRRRPHAWTSNRAAVVTGRWTEPRIRSAEDERVRSLRSRCPPMCCRSYRIIFGLTSPAAESMAFTSESGGPMIPFTAHRVWQRARRRSDGLIALHDLRHTGLTWASGLRAAIAN